jgi:hypothetical protein
LKSLQQFFNENIDERSSSITSIVSKMIWGFDVYFCVCCNILITTSIVL